nr:polyprotein P2a [Sowbane mosaic virus]
MYRSPFGYLLLLISLPAGAVTYDCIRGDCQAGPNSLMMALMTLLTTGMWWVVSLSLFWIERQRYRSAEEKISRPKRLRLIGDPYLDPCDGIVGKILDDCTGSVQEVVIQPKWWRFINMSSPTINQDEDNECAILGNSYSQVEPRREPGSFVLLKVNEEVVGAGCRVIYEGGDYLLTAHHVWSQAPNNIAKGGKTVEISTEMKPYLSSKNKVLDFCLVPIPAAVWSNLGVKSSKIASLHQRSNITVYGGTASTMLLSSFGVAEADDNPLRIIHKASTARAWSGSPLYNSNGLVLGVHLGYDQLGSTNRAVNIGYVLRMTSSNETAPPDLNFVEITEDEAVDRPSFDEYEIEGFGKIRTRAREYYIPRDKDWNKYDDEDDDAFFDVPVALWLNSNETVEKPLNFKGAASSPRLPPLLSSGITPGKAVDTIRKESDYNLLVGRLVSLERALEKLSQSVLNLQVKPSQSCLNTIGQLEDQKLSLARSSSKQSGSDAPSPQKTSLAVATSSPASTQLPGPVVASEPTNGLGQQSKKKSRGSRRKGKRSAKTLAPAAH